MPGDDTTRDAVDVASLRRRLADVERHLREMPPHGGAARADLEATRRDLQRRLAGRT